MQPRDPPGCPSRGWAVRWSRAIPVPGRPRQERVPSPALLTDAAQLGPGGVEVALGALSPAAQLAA